MTLASGERPRPQGARRRLHRDRSAKAGRTHKHPRPLSDAEHSSDSAALGDSVAVGVLSSMPLVLEVELKVKAVAHSPHEEHHMEHRPRRAGLDIARVVILEERA